MGERIVFVGRNTQYPLSIFSLLELYQGLSSHHSIIGVIHTCEKSINTFSLENVAKSLQIPSFKFIDNEINSEEAITLIKRLEPTLIIVVQFPKIFSSNLFSIPAKGCFNIHRGYPLRGGSIDQRLILNQFTSCSLIFHAIDDGIDTGNILEKENILLDPEHETGESIDSKTTIACIKLFRNKIISRIERSDFQGNKQDINQTNYANKWSVKQKIIFPETICYEEGERLARAISHPREHGLLLIVKNKPYVWTFSHNSEECFLIEVQWKDQRRLLLLKEPTQSKGYKELISKMTASRT